MRKSVVNFASAIFGRQKPEAATMRFFINRMIDAETNNPESLLIPESTVKTFIEDIEKRIRCKVKASVENGSDGLYLGAAGIAYMYYHLSRTPSLSSKHKEFITEALEYISPALIVAEHSSTSKSDLAGFILGNSGIYATAATIYNAVADESLSKKYRDLFYKIAPICKQTNFLRCGSDEYFVGRAGKHLAVSKLANRTIRNENIFLE